MRNHTELLPRTVDEGVAVTMLRSSAKQRIKTDVFAYDKLLLCLGE